MTTHPPHDTQVPASHGEGALHGLLAEYDTPGELVEAARRVRDAGYTDFDCYSPFPVHGIDPAMGIKRTILPVLIFGGGVLGAIGGLALQWYSNAYAWTWNVSGKPVWSIPANIPVAYECAILLAVFASFFGMWGLNKLPQVWHPLFRLERFARVTDDGFFLGIEARDRRFDAEKTKQLLQDAGAIAIEPCYLDPNPQTKQMPKWVFALIISTAAIALIPFALAAKARSSRSNQPHIHIFPDMDFQPKYRSDQGTDLFADGRANRGQVAGTIARGGFPDDALFYRGVESGEQGDAWTTGFPTTYPNSPEVFAELRGTPFVVDMKLLKRGQQRYNIYCSPCHGYDGRGQGMVPERVKAGGGVWLARNLVEAPDAEGKGGVVIQMANGQLFNTITNGFQTMTGYGGQITAADRWAIVAYVRALQRAQNASAEDIPADQRGSIR